MLKKFVSSLLVLVMLSGCSSSSSTSTSATADSIATSLISDLGIDASMSETKERIIKGMIFDGEDVTTDAALYLSSESGNSDTVGVFFTDDVTTCKSDINSYLDSQKANAQTYNTDQVFKISNAVIDDNGSIVIVVVCDDIENAKKLVKQALK